MLLVYPGLASVQYLQMLINFIEAIAKDNYELLYTFLNSLKTKKPKLQRKVQTCLYANELKGKR